MPDPIQSLCEAGQQALLATDYLAAERHLVAAESLAWKAADYETLARLYMPLQEARRQRRQFSGDGAFGTLIVKADAATSFASDFVNRAQRGQFIVAGFGSIAPAVASRAIASARGLYLDLPLAAAYDIAGQTVILFVPTVEVTLPPAESIQSIDRLLQLAPPHSLAAPADSLPPDQKHGDAGTFGYMMSVWESLHGPYLAAADATTDAKQKLIGYRQAIRVDYACEFAHQRFSHTARELAKQR